MPTLQVGPEFFVSSEGEVAALDLETLPRSEVGKVDSEFRLNVSFGSVQPNLIFFSNINFA